MMARNTSAGRESCFDGTGVVLSKRLPFGGMRLPPLRFRGLSGMILYSGVHEQTCPFLGSASSVGSSVQNPRNVSGRDAPTRRAARFTAGVYRALRNGFCVGVLLLLAGCNPFWLVGEVEYARHGVSPSTEYALFRMQTDGYIRDEIAGREPAPLRPDITWKMYWKNRYSTLRSVYAADKAASYIDYIHQQRRQYGLPLYDPQGTNEKL